MNVTVIGAGTMGSGIAQVAAMAGHDVTLCDVGGRELDRGIAAISSSLDRFAAKGLLDASTAEILRRIGTETSLATASSTAEIVIEAVPEILSLKRDVLAEVERYARPATLIATNTSQLTIGAVGERLAAARRYLVGMHFFNPPAIMKLVELIRGPHTTDDTVERARAFAVGLGKETVVCAKDSAGFITSRAYTALRLECIRILEEGVATADDIDRALKLGYNLPMGPLELGDFNGLDMFLHVASSLHEAYGERFAPPETLRALVAQGKLGRKSGEGFFRYDSVGVSTRTAGD